MGPLDPALALPAGVSALRRVVALGGGTGLPAVLRGLRNLVQSDDESALTAVVAMSDDGGSSGRLRRGRRIPPPGDVRNCLVALSAEEDLLAALFQHRYASRDGEELDGHSLGNLILTALAEQTGSFLRAVEMSSRVLRTVGRILPVTLEDVTLEAVLEDGTRRCGESAIGNCPQHIERIELVPATARPTPGVTEAILQADLVVIGPGSLYTSLLPTLLLPEVAEAVRQTTAARVLVANLVSERGEAAGQNIRDHVAVIEAHVGGRCLDAVLTHAGPIDAPTRERYAEEGAVPLAVPPEGIPTLKVIRHDLLAAGSKLRHDPALTASGLFEAWTQCARPAPAAVRR